MRMFALIATLAVALSSRAETLREFLKSNGIPDTSFEKAELDGSVNGSAASRNQISLAAYVRVKGDALTGNPILVRYDHGSGVVLHSQVNSEDDDRCCGTPEEIEFAGDYVILSFHVNPSAETMLVVGKDLKLVTTLYGFNVHEVAPGEVAFIENMIHFAPVHPERLQLADLRSGRKTELYPPKGDALRAAFAREHAQHLPPRGTCGKMNDPCTPDLYDEDIDFVDVDGHGSFAFMVHRDAAHATEEGQPMNTVASEAALYRYAWSGSAWLYCEEKLADEEAKSLAPLPGHVGGSTINGRCTPTLPVTPDLSNANYSPFDRHRAVEPARKK